MAKGYRGLTENHYLLKLLGAGGKLHSVIEKVNADNKYWLGMRDNRVMLYYMGGKILEISAKGNLSFDDKYLKHSNISNIGALFAKISDWEKNEQILRNTIYNFQSSSHNEKIAQQEIMLENNKTKDAEWFLVDMEYSVPGISYGRFDMIAISKKKDKSGKYRIALVELKSGTDAFGGAKAIRDHNKKIIDIERYGSGIAGHINNFYEFLYGPKAATTVKNLAKEIATIIKNYNELGIDTPFLDLRESDINIEPVCVECIILCTDVDLKNTDAAYHKARRFIFKNEYKSSELCLESDFCWNKNKEFDQKYGKLVLHISIVDKERVIKRNNFKQLKK